jgi:hypothetical protein
MMPLEHLGSVSSQSGILVVLDTGYLNLWSHEARPIMPLGVLDSEEATRRVNTFVDIEIVGPDAAKAGRLLDMSWHPLYVYDQPPEHPELQKKFNEVVREHRLRANLRVLPDRISHRGRVDLALEQGNGAGEIQFHGIWASVVAGVPISASMAVIAERSSSDNSCWKRVSVECRPDVAATRSEKIGFVAVDYARLLIADVDALRGWQHEESLDGMADYVFWGRDAETLAKALNAPTIARGEFGWLNLPFRKAEEKALAVRKYRDDHSLKLADDFRPHSHHWQVMTPTRASPTESATVEMNSMDICNFMTTWGDGLFEVYREISEVGDLVRIRIEFEG